MIPSEAVSVSHIFRERAISVQVLLVFCFDIPYHLTMLIEFFHIHFAGGTKFNSSQYAFFGNNAMEEVELGGLEDDGCGDADFVGLGDEKYPFIRGSDMLEVILYI